MTGDRFDGYQDPDDCGPAVSLLMFSFVAFMVWLLVATCAESAQVVIP